MDYRFNAFGGIGHSFGALTALCGAACAAIALFAAPASAQTPDAAAPETAGKTAYLFTYFVGNGEDGLHLAVSDDGLKWDALKDGKSYLEPKVGKSKLMRDPCVAKGPDGTFHMVWTDSWDSQTIGHASTKDFITWSDQQAIEVMKDEPTVRNCWAPEITWDAGRDQFVIYWASTIPGQYPKTEYGGKNDNNHRIYATTTSDFKTFSPTKLYFNPGFNCIDSTLLVMPADAPAAAGQTVMIFKDESKVPKAMKNLRLAVAPSQAGPFKVDPKPINPPGAWVEGPTTLRIGDWVYVYFDAYTRHHYGVLRSKDLKTWEDLTPQLKMPGGIRHGTAIAVDAELADALRDAK